VKSISSQRFEVAMDRKILRSGNWSVGDIFTLGGVRYRIEFFPTKTSVVGQNINPKDGETIHLKVDVSKIKKC
jgi:hypothetical protein